MKKKLFAIFITLCMVLTMMPSAVFAEENNQQTRQNELWQMLYSDTILDLENKESIDAKCLKGWIEMSQQNTERAVYLYMAKTNGNSYDISTLMKVETGAFEIKYVLDNTPTFIAGTGIALIKHSDGVSNHYIIKKTETQEEKYSEGTGTYEVRPSLAGKDFYNFDVKTKNDSNGEGNQGGALCTVFTRNPISQENNPEILTYFNMQIEGTENQTVSETFYAYTATYEAGKYKNFQLITGGFKNFYIWSEGESGPQYATNSIGLEIATGEGLEQGQYLVEVNPNVYNNFADGTGKYDIYPDGQQNCMPFTLIINKTQQPSSKDQYNIWAEKIQDAADGYTEDNGFSLVDGMAGFGQGRVLNYTKKDNGKKIDSWYVCFFAKNAVTGEAAVYNKQSSNNGRIYIGSTEDFEIQARPISESGEPSGSWSLQTDENKAYEIMETGKTYRGSQNVFKISYIEDKVDSFSQAYEYRVHYIGNDEFLTNGNQDNDVDIGLEFDNSISDFTMDMEEIKNGQVVGESNYHSFYRDKSDYSFKLVIRPGMLKRAEDKVNYESVVYIEDDVKSLDFSSKKSPFTISWDAENKYYTISYTHPNKDIYGPDYFLEFTSSKYNNINELINEAFNTSGEHQLEEGIGFSTGKLTVRPDKIGHNNTINAADKKKEVDVTEVRLENGFQKSIQGNELNVETNQGYVSFTGSVVTNIKNESGDVSYEVRDVKNDPSYLEDKQLAALDDKNIYAALDFELAAGEETIKFGSTGNAEIRIPMESFEGKSVYYLGDDGKFYSVNYYYDGEQDVIVNAKHFSTYVVMDTLDASDVNEDPYVPEKDPTPPSGGGGGGAVLPPAQETPADEPVQSGSTTSTDLSGSTVNKGGDTTTTMDKAVADKIVEMAATNKSEEVVINTVTKNDSAAQSVKSAEVTLPAETLGAIAEKTDANVVIKTDVAEVKLDNMTAEAIAQQAQASGKEETVSIKAEKVKEEAKEVRFELKVVTSSGTVISDFQGGNVSVTVNVPQSLSNKKLVCVYIDENGKYHKIDGAINEAGTQYTFTTGHFSTYSVMLEEEADAVIKQQTADEQKAKIKKVKATVTLSTKDLKKGIRVTVKVPEAQKADKTGIIIYRSTSKNAKTYAVYKKVATKGSTYIIRNTKNVKGQKLTSGKKYYYKVRAYKVIDGKTYYGPMSAVKYIKAK